MDVTYWEIGTSFVIHFIHIITGSTVSFSTGTEYIYKSLTPRRIMFTDSQVKWLTFKVKACHDVHIGLTESDNDYSGKMYEIVIGGWNNNETVIRNSRQQKLHMASYPGPVLSCSAFKEFYVQWIDGIITVGRGKDPFRNKMTSWSDPDPMRVNFAAVSTGFESSGEWDFPDFECIYSLKAAYRTKTDSLNVEMTTSVAFEDTAFSLGECAIMCVRSMHCVTYMYNDERRVCRGFTTTFTSQNEGQISPGTNYFTTY